MGFSDYNYPHFTRELLGLLEKADFAGPEPGERAPDFKGVTLDGKTAKLSDLRGKTNVLLVFGSATCPMTAASMGGINRLCSHFNGAPVQFIFVYVREAHPGDQIPAHRTADDKVRAALLLRAEENLGLRGRGRPARDHPSQIFRVAQPGVPDRQIRLCGVSRHVDETSRVGISHRRAS